jgi:hypothetical protein
MERTSKTPQMLSRDYQQRYPTPCDHYGEHGQMWYKGTGIDPAQHPLANQIPFGNCGLCKSDKVLVVATQFNVHPSSGDRYWDAEVRCEECGTFTARSYAEN